MVERNRKRHYLTLRSERSASGGSSPKGEELAKTLLAEAKVACQRVEHWQFVPADGSVPDLAEEAKLDLEALYSAMLHDSELEPLLRACEDPDNPLQQIGIDIPLHRTDYWNPAEATWPLFGNRDAAHRLMGLPPLLNPLPNRSVNVVIIDQGVDKEVVEFESSGVFAGGWSLPGSGAPFPGKTRGGHGSMLARNILAVAPGARILDLPLIPQNVVNVPVFLSAAHGAFQDMLATIEKLRNGRNPRWKAPWVIVNAWATFNRENEHEAGKPGHLNHPLNYTSNRNHPLNKIVACAAKMHDLVFAAGNCGQFCPMADCGGEDIGPGRSILGANSLPEVLTVGAVRVDRLWLGYSSQGPGTLSKRKPDLCAPSQFSENYDEFASNTGTSAACALAAGVVARLRSELGIGELTPAEMKTTLIKSAQGSITSAQESSGEVPWDKELGAGIINAERALKEARAILAGRRPARFPLG